MTAILQSRAHQEVLDFGVLGAFEVGGNAGEGHLDDKIMVLLR